MMKHSFAGALLLAAALLAGCGAQPGTTTVTYDSFAKYPPPLATACSDHRRAWPGRLARLRRRQLTALGACSSRAHGRPPASERATSQPSAPATWASGSSGSG